MICTKKILLPLSMLSLFGPVQAQTSVALYGVIDLGIAYAKGSRSNAVQVLPGGLHTPRLGFRATEGLGNGMSASLVLEAGYDPDDGMGKATNTNNQRTGNTVPGGLTFNRRATLSLSGPWGEVRAGRDYVPQYMNFAIGDPHGLVGFGIAMPRRGLITGPAAIRASNSVSYHTPRSLGGFGINAMHYRGENPGGTPTSDDGNGAGIRLSYEQGPFIGGIATGRTNYAAGDSIQRNIAAAWDFGTFRVMAFMNSDRAGTLSARGGVAGVQVPVGSGQFRFAYSYHRTDAPGNPEGRKLALGYVYNLSKQTALYTTVARISNSGGAAHALVDDTTGANESTSGIVIGMRKHF
ncbi:porin [Pseudoduganella umbonata]|uniref:Porin n=1 Tax=Pseudoduganella umbonata TaxID=864828 RepID=A0A4P8HLK3_9BURK|nr:porin [Pseudoduganella umbonata]MBB3221604.1 putative porin [Pseudoduganella umbonata]QCP09160.1 porin [Pseudoduganella umbonata]